MKNHNRWIWRTSHYCIIIQDHFKKALIFLKLFQVLVIARQYVEISYCLMSSLVNEMLFLTSWLVYQKK